MRIYDNAGLRKKYLKTKVLYWKNRFLLKDLRRLLCNALIQSHFDYACGAWYSNLKKKYRKKLHVLQNKCKRFCLQLDNREHIRTEHFDKTSWLPIDQRCKQRLSKSVLNSSLKCVLNMRTEFTKYPIKEYYKYYNLIQIPTTKDCLSYLQPFIRNGLPDDVKLPKNANAFKHKVKKSFLTSKCLCILWVDYHHHHFILIMEL